MAALTIQTASATGGTLSFAAASSGGDTAAVTGRVLLIFRNDHGSASRTVTIAAVDTTRPTDGVYPALTVPNISMVIAAGAYAIAGPILSAYLNDGVASITYSDSGADIVAAAVRI